MGKAPHRGRLSEVPQLSWHRVPGQELGALAHGERVWVQETPVLALAEAEQVPTPFWTCFSLCKVRAETKPGGLSRSCHPGHAEPDTAFSRAPPAPRGPRPGLQAPLCLCSPFFNWRGGQASPFSFFTTCACFSGWRSQPFWSLDSHGGGLRSTPSPSGQPEPAARSAGRGAPALSVCPLTARGGEGFPWGLW